MIITLTGANSFSLINSLKQKRLVFVEAYGDLAIETIDVAGWDLRQVFDALGALPFLSPRRMVIMSGLVDNKQASEHIDALLESVSDQTELLIFEAKLDKRSVLYKTLKKSTDFMEFTEPDTRELPKWLVAEAKNRNGTISLSDANYLVSRVGAGQQMLSNELDKLILFNTDISRTAIDILTEQALTSSIFELIDAAFAGNAQKALALYADQRAQNTEPIAIEALFVWQLHVLALLKSAGTKSFDAVAAESGISPYVAKKSAGAAAKRSFSAIKNYIHELANLELAMKSLSVDADELMKNYILLLSTD